MHVKLHEQPPSCPPRRRRDTLSLFGLRHFPSAQNLIWGMIVIPRISTKECIPVRQGRLGNYYTKQPAFTTALELEEVTIAVDEGPVFEREIGPKGAVCASERFHVLFVISYKSLDLSNAIFVLNDQNL